MIDWKRKLTSRKFWVALTGFVTGLIIYFGGTEAMATQVSAIIMSGASVIAYIIGEGLADAGNSGNTVLYPELVTAIEENDESDGGM